MNAKEDNDVTNHISAVYAKNNVELSWSIRLGAYYDKNQIG